VPTTPGSASSSFTPPPDVLRAPTQTDIGDPVTADLCATVGLAVFRNLRPGLTPAFDPVQYPPGCSVTESAGTAAVVQFSVFAEIGDPATVAGRTTRTIAGQTIYVYPFDAVSGACPRDIKITGVLLTVDASPQGNATADEGLSCAGTDAMANKLAAALADQQVPRLPLASPSVSVLDACAVARKAGVTGLSDFSGADILSRGFGVSCEVKPVGVFLFFNFAVADTAQPSASAPVTVGGHQVFQTSARPDFCSFVSVQSTTADGRYEEVTATSTLRGGASVPQQLCEQTGQALAQYLTAAGLP
jgi:hypothetical protein